MTERSHATLLRRMTRSHEKEVVENPLTSSRAVRLALTKAANDTVGLAITVSGIAEEVTVLDDVLGSLSEDLMLVELKRHGSLAGLIAIDMQLRSAVLEMETIGATVGAIADPRPPTRADKVMCDPFIAAFLMAFPTSVKGTPFEGWGDDVAVGEQFEGTRSAGLVLDDRDYRVVRMSVDLGVADRQGLLVMALPLADQKNVVDPEPLPKVDWKTAFDEVVLSAPASLDAVLHRFHISLAQANTLKVGTLLPLTGCSVNSVRLIAPNGQDAGQAKLGQVGGKRAVRLQSAPLPELQELPSAALHPSVRPALSEILPQDMSATLSAEKINLPLQDGLDQVEHATVLAPEAALDNV